MLSVMQTALGGIQRNQAGLQVTAENIANVNTDGYRSRRLDGATGQVTFAQDPPPPSEGAESPPASDVDLASELVHMKTYAVGVEANAKVVAVADRLLGELMDILG